MHKFALLFAVLAIFLAVHATDPNQPPERPDYDPQNVTMSNFLTWMKEWLPHTHMLPSIYRTIKSHQLKHRFQVWKQTVKAVWEQNHKVDELWTAGLNMFSHLTDEEFKNIDWGLRLPEDFNMTHPINTPQPVDPEMQKRAGKEWKGTSKVKAVRNQGQCGSCWAFAAAGALEGGLSTDVNPQEILDCSGAGSCNGGFPDRGIGYGQKGVTPFGSYNGGSYKAAQGQCAARSSRKCTGQVQSANNDAGLVRLLNNGPVSVNINADGLKNYKSGVANAPCSNSINHAVLATGYSGSAYMVKNSWGSSWGSGGYFQFAQNRNQCGISSMCYQPTGCR